MKNQEYDEATLTSDEQTKSVYQPSCIIVRRMMRMKNHERVKSDEHAEAGFGAGIRRLPPRELNSEPECEEAPPHS